MYKNAKKYFLLWLLGIVIIFNGCGYTGPLYLPEKASTNISNLENKS